MFKKKNNEIKLPNKSTMNLYQYDYKNDPKRILTLTAVAVFVISIVLAKFLVLDKVVEMNSIKARNVELEAQLVEMETRAEGYQELKENYYRYSESYSKDEEKLVDRIVITSLLKNTTTDLADITSTTINGNLVNIQVITKDMEDLRQFREKLNESNLVVDVNVYSAARSEGDVISNVSFKCAVEEEAE